jgi:hypothetical protein
MYTSPDSHMPPEFVMPPHPCKNGMVLNDPQSQRWKQVASHRERFGKLLHKAVALFSNEGSESSIDAIRVTVGSIGTFLGTYGVGYKGYANLWKSHKSGLDQVWMTT